MAKTTGIDMGDLAVKAVMLDGSYRKTRLVGYRIERIAEAADAAGRAEAEAAAIDAAVKEGKLAGQQRLGYPCREAVLRAIEVPFRGHDAIRKVIKGEIEGEIHSHSVDDMVVDFHEVGKGVDGTRVIVAAVPKPGLKALLDALEARGHEPEQVDLDTMALYRAAHWCGAFSPDDEEMFALEEDGAEDVKVEKVEAPRISPKRAPKSAPKGAPGLPVTAVLDLGARSVRVLLVEGENLVDMRTLRLGDATIADDVARRHALPFATARDAVAEVFATGREWQGEVTPAVPAVAGAEPAEGEAAAIAAPVAVTVEREEVDAARDAFLQRLGRELVRFLTSTGRAGKITNVHVTGTALATPGILDVLAEVFGTELHELDVLAKLQHDLPPEEVDAVRSSLAVAVGLALGGMGGPEGFQLRQEDLAFTRGFDRLKFPLAITCMIAWFAALVWAVKLNTDLSTREYMLGRTWEGAKTQKLPVFHGMLWSVVSSGWFQNDLYFRYATANGRFYKYEDLLKELETKPVPERLKFVLSRLQRVVDEKQKESGVFEDVKADSGLAVLVRFAEVMKRAEPQLGRYLLVKLELNMKAPNRWLEFKVAFREDLFNERTAALEEAWRQEQERPDTPFEKDASPGGGATTDRFVDSEASGVQGAYCRYRVSIKDFLTPFGPGAPQVGAVTGAGEKTGDKLASGEAPK